MILLDTHIWIWLVNGTDDLKAVWQDLILSQESDGIGVSVISCWEVAKLVEKGRLQLKLPVNEWIDLALAYPGMQLLELTPKIAVESTQLPGYFHRDPADQIIVATSRAYNIPLLTANTKIRNYPHVQLADAPSPPSR
ncbi:MAG TPA: type II toxin-antitoxin system VapC family toxin [Caldilineae bacterium]|nr:type II toxin-antitoxin system VapC family toxin [Caldilineae bacterium]